MYRLITITAVCAVLAACADGEPLGSELSPQFGKPPSVTDPTATWLFPLAATGLAVASDGKYPSGGIWSAYQNGVCGVTSKIFATTAASNSGDATMQTDNPKNADRKCTSYPRQLTFTYPDAVSETTTVFGNLHEIQNTTYSIPIGATVKRALNLSSSTSASRCGTLRWRTTLRTGEFVGGDSVLVTRVDASTWDVETQAAPNNKANCANTGEVYEMPLRFRVVSATPLP